tara:strand:+ start:70 stop:354 length:285 start_codon:yes stop_codon:yes gene_type:complete
MSTTREEIFEMKLKIETLEDKIDSMDVKLDRLTKQLLDPDNGYAARVNQNTSFRQNYQDSIKKIYELESWKNNVSKALWVIYASLIGGGIKLFL